MKESGPNSNQQEKAVNDVKPETRCFFYHHRIIVFVITIIIVVVIVIIIIVIVIVIVIIIFIVVIMMIMMMLSLLTQSLEPPSSRSINHNKQALHRGHHDHDRDDDDDDDRSSHNSRPSQSITLFSESCPLINYKSYLSGILIYWMGQGFILWNVY